MTGLITFATNKGAGQSAFGRRSGESARPGEQLAFREWAALLDVDSSRAPMALVIGADLLREVLDDLAVTDQQQVVVGRQHVGDLGEEAPRQIGRGEELALVHFLERRSPATWREPSDSVSGRRKECRAGGPDAPSSYPGASSGPCLPYSLITPTRKRITSTMTITPTIPIPPLR